MTRRFLVTFSLALLAILLPASVASAQATHVRWDIVSLVPPNVSADGVASALASDGAMITLTGNGTFTAPDGAVGISGAVTGGGAWATIDALGAPSGNGTYWVVGLVNWTPAPGTLPTPPNDLIGDPNERAAGLATLRVRYSDGSHGILVVSCHLNGTPDTVFEGVNASKGFVHYFEHVAPVAGVDANRTLFHVRQ